MKNSTQGNKVIFCIGLPASGKSTWSKEFCNNNIDWVRVNRDDIRNMRGKYWIPKDEKLISKIEFQIIKASLEEGKNVIVDSTNLNTAYRTSLISKIDNEFPNTVISIANKYFTDISVEECIKRDLKRPNSVGKDVILRMYNEYLAPDPIVYKEDVTLPHCVIVDVDGTLAEKGDRSPFDWAKVGQDTVREQVAGLVRILHQSGKDIIIFTGRDGVCEEETRQWLIDNSIPFNRLFIRPIGDCRKDSIVKKELFEEKIRGNYYVDFVLDDRQQVVDMYRRDLGIDVFQVNYGDF